MELLTEPQARSQDRRSQFQTDPGLVVCPPEAWSPNLSLKWVGNLWEACTRTPFRLLNSDFCLLERQR
jgi:hypothetical protein